MNKDHFSPAGQGDALATLVSTLRAMASNYTAGHSWDHLDADVCRRAAEALASRQPVGQEPITVEAVGTVRVDGDGERHIDWLTEGGISDLEAGDVLMVSDRSITDDSGSGEVYTTPSAQAVDLLYSLDVDPAGIRARVCDVVTGTLMVGAQGHTPPPPGHWAEPFWKAARADAAAQDADLGQLEHIRNELHAMSKQVPDDWIDPIIELQREVQRLIDGKAVANG